MTKKSGTIEILEEELLDVLLDGDDLRLDLAALVLGHAGSNHRPRHTTSPTVESVHCSYSHEQGTSRFSISNQTREAR